MLHISDFRVKKQKENSFNLVGKIKVKILVICAFIVASLFFAQLVFANNLAVDGQKLSEIEDQIAKLEEDNTTLRAEIAKESSLSTLSQRAEEMGFEKPSKLTTF